MRFLKEQKDFETSALPKVTRVLEGIIKDLPEQNVIVVMSIAKGNEMNVMTLGCQKDIDEMFTRIDESEDGFIDTIKQALRCVKMFRKFKKKGRNNPDSRISNSFDILDKIKDLKNEMTGGGFNDMPNISDMFAKLIDKDPNFFMIAKHRMIELFEQKGIPTPASINVSVNGDELMAAFKDCEKLIR